MKRIILFLAVCVLSLVSYAQEIILDRYQDDGSRIIMCKPTNISETTDDVQFSVALAVGIESDTAYYHLNISPIVTHKFYIDKGLKLLIKDLNGNVITLKSTIDSDGTEQHHTTRHGYDEIIYYNLTSYVTDEKTIKQLSQGIQKIRMQHNGGIFEKVFDVDIMGETLRKQLALIKERYKDPTNIYSGF